MFGFNKYLLGGAAIAMVALSGLLLLERNKTARLTTENARLSRSVASFEAQAAVTAHARRVEAARALRWADRVAVLDASIEALRTGEIADVPLDPRIIDILDGL